jgi:hypothetical protein
VRRRVASLAAEDDRRELRANPAYRLVLFDRLEPAERAALAGAAAEPDFYGVLRPPTGSALGIKSVDRETALLFLTLREAGPLPGYVRALRGEETPRLVARLVADGILEVAADGPDGGFVSGAAAMELLATREHPAGRGRLAELSLAALRYGSRLAIDDPLALSWRLYGFNRLPLTPAWRRRLASAGAVEGYLGIDRGGPHRRLLDGAFVATGSDAGWLSWSARRPGAPRGGAGGGATFKLFVSPQPEALPALMDGLLGGLVEAGAASFKIGSAASGLLRPDKVVAYFADFETLAAAAEPLAGRLAGAPVHGVPFTSEIAGGGLLSWGIDPPPGAASGGGARSAAAALPWSGGESWRLWLTHRLARALLQARAAAAAEPWRFALERLELEGIDTASWTPPAALFRES